MRAMSSDLPRFPCANAVELLSKRRGVMVYRWRLDVNVKKKGRKRDFGFEGTEDDARLRVAEIRKAIVAKAEKEKRDAERGLVTVGDVLKVWAESPNNKGEKRDVKGAYYNRLVAYMGSKPLEDVAAITEEFVKTMKSVKSKSDCDAFRLRRPPKAATINRHIAIVKASYFFAAHPLRRLIDRNYMAGYNTLPENNIRYRILSDEERVRWYAALPEDMKPLWYFMSRAPSRLSEIINLRKSRGNLNLFTKQILLHQGATKSGRGRKLYIFPEMMNYFRNLPDEVDELFFRIVHGRRVPWTVESVEHHWKKTGERAGIPTKQSENGYNFHKMRQQAAMQMIADGHSLRVVKLVGGWAQNSTAINNYLDDQTIYELETGMIKFDHAWKTEMAPEVFRAA